MVNPYGRSEAGPVYRDADARRDAHPVSAKSAKTPHNTIQIESRSISDASWIGRHYRSMSLGSIGAGLAGTRNALGDQR